MGLSKEQYKKALLTDGILKDRSLELLSALYDAPNCEATAPQLAEVLGYSGFSPVNSLIGHLGKRIAGLFNFTKADIKTEYTGWWQLIANGKETENGFTWWLKGNLFDALVELNLLQENEIKIFPEALSPFEELSEGKKKTVTVNAYERNSVARSICIKHYGATCSVCEFSFEKIYGDIGKNFIHVHHLIELSTIKSEYKVHPINDLRPVCPNCHAMLHQKKPPYTIEYLKKKIQRHTKQVKVSEIFNDEPPQWGLRGDPYLWQEMKEKLIETEMPSSANELQELIEATYEDITGYPISYDKQFAIEKFKHGGMSSGYISPDFWVNRGIPLLVKRHNKP